MRFDQIILEKENGIARITLNRPQALNTLTVSLLQEMQAALDAIQRDDAIGIVILTGAGKSFSAGVDLKSLESETPPGEEVGVRLNLVAREVLQSMEALPKPIIAVVNGFCLTGGLEIALGCDLIIASDNAKFGDTHVRWGLHPTWGLSQKLPRLVGLLKAKELSFTAATITAVEAEKIGLINRVYPAEELEAAVQKLTQAILSNSRPAIACYKMLINRGYRGDLADGLALEFDTPLDVNDAGKRTHAFRT